MPTDRLPFIFASLAVALACCPAQAVTIDLVTVGNPGNAADAAYRPGVGSVDYTFRMGKYEITAGQYCEFLNAVAKTDTYGLYSPSMDIANNAQGCNIKRTGNPGAYSYSVAPDWANRPAANVSWGDIARFCNWLTNGQPSGNQSLETTEDGSYYLNGADDNASLIEVTRKPEARYVIPSDNEWHKSAYFDPEKPGVEGYWKYPLRSDSAPSNQLSSTGTNNACFYDYYAFTYPDPQGYTIGAPYYRTEAGAFAGTPGPYGTFDQGGNVWEWAEDNYYGWARPMFGGSYLANYTFMWALYHSTANSPKNEYVNVGFRVAYVPEPATFAIFAAASLALLRRRGGII